MNKIHLTSLKLVISITLTTLCIKETINQHKEETHQGVILYKTEEGRDKTKTFLIEFEGKRVLQINPTLYDFMRLKEGDKVTYTLSYYRFQPQPGGTDKAMYLFLGSVLICISSIVLLGILIAQIGVALSIR